MTILEKLRDTPSTDLLHASSAELLEWKTDLRTQRDADFAQMKTIRQSADGRAFTRAQESDFTAAENRCTEAADLLERVEDAIDRMALRGQAIVATGREPGRRSSLSVTRNESTYRPDDGPDKSWVRDLISAGMHSDSSAAERLHRNNSEVGEQRAVNTGGASGFVPPLWLVEEYVALARAGRVIANRLRSRELPVGTMNISLPRVATGAGTAIQATENTAVQNTDATFDSITADVTTVAGQQVISRQLVEQAAINIDGEIIGDLLADLAVKVDQFVISNNAANKRGLLSVSGINAITFTHASPTVGLLYPKLADGIQQIHTQRYMAADHIFMHPRRWGWIMAAVDGQQRPLAVPAANAPQNVIAAVGDVAAEGFVGSMHGLPVFVDPNIPTNLGAGVNEDRIIIDRTADQILFESLPRAEVLHERYADQLSVGIVVFEFLALHSERRPKAISVLAGTGLAAPTF